MSHSQFLESNKRIKRIECYFFSLFKKIKIKMTVVPLTAPHLSEFLAFRIGKATVSEFQHKMGN